MTEHKEWAEIVGRTLTKPMIRKPGDSGWKTAGRLGYMIVSPAIVGPAVIGAHFADEVRAGFHVRDVLGGYSTALRNMRTMRTPSWRELTRPKMPMPAPKVHKPPQTRMQHSQPLHLRNVPSYKLRQPSLHLTRPKVGLHAGKLNIAKAHGLGMHLGGRHGLGLNRLHGGRLGGHTHFKPMMRHGHHRR